jgi:hypothetical protein
MCSSFHDQCDQNVGVRRLTGKWRHDLQLEAYVVLQHTYVDITCYGYFLEKEGTLSFIYITPHIDFRVTTGGNTTLGGGKKKVSLLQVKQL